MDLLAIFLDNILPHGDDKVPVESVSIAKARILLDPHAAPRDFRELVQSNLRKRSREHSSATVSPI